MRSSNRRTRTLTARGVAALVLCISLHSQSTAGPRRRSEAAHSPSVSTLRVEYADNPLGIDVRVPRLAWRIAADGRGVVQSAYEIRVARTEADVEAGANLVWSSGKVASSESTQVEYGGAALQSRERLYWQVRVWDGGGRASEWSAPAWWEMGLLAASDWRAEWIEPEVGASAAVPLMRRDFTVDGTVERARAYVTAHGLYELWVNGRRVGDQLFTPGWTSYQRAFSIRPTTSPISSHQARTQSARWWATAGIAASSVGEAARTFTGIASGCSLRSKSRIATGIRPSSRPIEIGRPRRARS